MTNKIHSVGKLMPSSIAQSDIFGINSPFQFMEATLIVKNFGPIKSVELTLKNVNVFIGPQSTGKSALAKLFTILKSPRRFMFKEDGKYMDDFISALRHFNILSFAKEDTEIVFSSQLHQITFNSGVLNYEPKFLNEIILIESLSDNFEVNRNEIISKLTSIEKHYVNFTIQANTLFKKRNIELNNWEEDLKETNFPNIIGILRTIESQLSEGSSFYIPAERSLVNFIGTDFKNLPPNTFNIPTHVLSFIEEIKQYSSSPLDLSFIQKGLKYSLGTVYINDNDRIKISESASGIQSIVPLLIGIWSPSQIGHRSFVVEEPELNLSPIAQYELIKLLESRRNDPYHAWEDHGTIHTYTTHSPYILSALNNLLYASKVFYKLNSKIDTINDLDELINKNRDTVKKVTGAMIDPKSFAAYQILEGRAESIFDEKNGLIIENYIDDASDKLDDDFSDLMDLTR